MYNIQHKARNILQRTLEPAYFVTDYKTCHFELILYSGGPTYGEPTYGEATYGAFWSKSMTPNLWGPDL